MKKWFRILTLSVLVLFLCGCSSTPDLTSTEYMHFTQKGRSCVKPSGVVDIYPTNDFVEHVNHPIDFQSYEEMADDVLTGNFTEEEMHWLRELSRGLGYYRLAFDVNKSPIPVFPESWNLELSKVQFHVYGFKAYFRSAKTEKAVLCTFEYHFQDRFQDFSENFSIWSSENGFTRVISNNETTLYLWQRTGDDYRDYVVQGKINGMAFEIEIFDSADWLRRMPTDEELLQIDIEYLDLKS